MIGSDNITAQSAGLASRPTADIESANGRAVEAGFSPYQNAPLSRYDASTGLLSKLVFLISASMLSDWLGGH